jgi:asparagine synthase (glutamine-hydrolysing)
MARRAHVRALARQARAETQSLKGRRVCGIVGVVGGAGIDPQVVARMRDTLQHRGPDHAGLWRSANGEACFGHQRLAIIDLDARANQPMCSPDGRFVIVFNGEIYNFRLLATELRKAGVALRTESDTEVLIEAYRLWGDAALDRLSGMFAFALWDARERHLICARDRAGEKPFYYAVHDGRFVFGSEIKALLQWPGLPRRLDHEALVDYLSFGFVPDPKSIWLDVRKLAPAHAMTVSLDAAGGVLVAAPRRYWSLRFGQPARTAVTGERIRAALIAAADEMAVADVPLGSFLSGGVDSSAVTAALSLAGHRVRSFTIGFDDMAYDERPWARKVARYATEHVERTVSTDDMMSVLQPLQHHYDEPFADYSSIPTYALCREARRSITVALSGDGADELFAGYRKYQRLARRAELRHLLPVGAARVLADLARVTLREGNHWRRTLAQYGLPVPRMLADMLCHAFAPDLLRQVARGPLAETLRHYSAAACVEQTLAAADADASAMNPIDAMRQLDFALTLPGDMLVKVDRASMAASLEVRPLFLHRALMELAASIPGAELAHPDAAKLALKDAVRPWLPADLIDRRKQGFALPLPKWLTQASEVAEEMFGDAHSGELTELLDLQRLASLRRSHAGGEADFSGALYATYTLDRWFATWMPR